MKNVFYIVVVGILFLTSFSVLAGEGRNISTLYYDECRKWLTDEQYEKYPSLQDNLCVKIQTLTYNYVFTRDKNDIGMGTLTAAQIDYLKKNYYRGEQLHVFFETTSGKKIPDLPFYTTGEKYVLEFLEDIIIVKYPILEKSCHFNSYKAVCKDSNLGSRVKNIEKNYVKTNLKSIGELSKMTRIELEEAIKNNRNTQERLAEITIDEKYVVSNFTRDYISYKLDVHTRIIENKLEDLKYIKKYGALKYGSFVKQFQNNISIRQDEFFTYFYLDGHRVNTIKNDLSHFNQEERTSVDTNNLLEKLVNKYVSYDLKGHEGSFALLEKNFSDKTMFIMIDKKNYHRYPVEGTIMDLKNGKSGNYVLTNSGKKHYLYRLSKNQTQLLKKSTEAITDFELLVGKIEIRFQSGESEYIQIQ